MVSPCSPSGYRISSLSCQCCTSCLCILSRILLGGGSYSGGASCIFHSIPLGSRCVLPIPVSRSHSPWHKRLPFLLLCLPGISPRFFWLGSRWSPLLATPSLSSHPALSLRLVLHHPFPTPYILPTRCTWLFYRSCDCNCVILWYWLASGGLLLFHGVVGSQI